MIGAKRKFKRETYTLGAGERLPLSIVASWLTVFAATKAFEVGIDGEDPQPIEAGLAINTDGYKQIVLRNPHDEAITIDVGFTSNEMRDSRLTASGVVNIAQTETIEVSEVGNRRLTDDGGSITKVGASSYVGDPGASALEIVSAAINTHGVILRTCVANRSTSGFVYMKVGGILIFVASEETGFGKHLDREFFISSGTAILVGGDGNTSLSVTYDILGG